MLETRMQASRDQVHDIQIKMENLCFFYDKVQALYDINLAIYKNQITAFIGASGCGKSTLLRVVNRIYSLYAQQHASGKLWLDGKNILDKKQNINRLRAKVGMVFQKPTPFPMSIFDNVAYGVRLYERLPRGKLEVRVEEALIKAALWDEVKDKLKQSGMTLSGGQQQRLCIARALAVEPDVLLLDEPTSALDPISTARIEALLDELKSRLTVLIVTHNMQQAARVSDQTVFMHQGRVIEHNATQILFTRPAEKQTEDYITGRFG